VPEKRSIIHQSEVQRLWDIRNIEDVRESHRGIVFFCGKVLWLQWWGVRQRDVAETERKMLIM
jgi:hypothetical protein